MKQLSENILDITMNSVRAGSPLTHITLTECGDVLTILIEDTGCGMSEEQVKNVTDPFFTTRTTRKVGLGLPFFKMGAEQTGGSFEIKSTLGKGTSVKATYNMDHIDSIPLGNMPETVMTIIGAAPELDFVFTHKRDGAEIVLDTRELRVQLEGVPLDTPEVLLWIKDYLEECYAESFGS